MRHLEFIRGPYAAAVHRLPTILVIASTTALVACSGSAADTGSVGAAFLARANTGCTTALNTLGAQPFPYDSFDANDPNVAQLPAVGTYFDSISFNHKEVAVMDAIGKPPHGRRAWSAFLSLVAREQDATQAQISAAKVSDKAGFVQSVRTLHDLGAQINAAAARLGFAKNDPCVVLLGTSTT